MVAATRAGVALEAGPDAFGRAAAGWAGARQARKFSLAPAPSFTIDHEPADAPPWKLFAFARFPFHNPASAASSRGGANRVQPTS